MKIKPGAEKEYEKYVSINSDDPYSKACITAGEAFGNAIDEGKTFDEAEQAMFEAEGGLTGFMVGAVMSAIAHFHPRGEEIKDWWNGKHNVAPGAKGTVNPAIITLRD